MKVSKIRTASTAPTKKARKTEASSASPFAEHLDSVRQKSEEVAPVGEVSGVTGVGSILAAQEVEEDDGKKARRQLRNFGEDILDRLDEIQRDLLMGAISKDRLTNLAQTLRAKKSTVDDPALLSIINDIELRAEVELAKYTRKI